MFAGVTQARVALVLFSLLPLTACQNAPMGTLPTPVNPIAAMQSVTEESCKQTFESYIQFIHDNSEKFDNVQAMQTYPEIVTYSDTLNRCMEKGFLDQLEMMKAMERVTAAIEGRPADEAGIEEMMHAMENWQKEMEQTSLHQEE